LNRDKREQASRPANRISAPAPARTARIACFAIGTASSSANSKQVVSSGSTSVSAA